MGAMERTSLSVLACLVACVIFTGVSSLKIRNKLLGQCLRVLEGRAGGGVSFGDCSPESPSLEWSWLPESHAIRSQHSGECLTAPGREYEGVFLQRCASSDEEEVMSSQAWSCSKKGHISLMGTGLSLSAAKESTLVFLLKDHKQGSRWRTLDDRTVCSATDGKENKADMSLQQGEAKAPRSHMSDFNMQTETSDGETGSDGTESSSVIGPMSPSSVSAKPPSDPTMVFFTMDYGMSWKITMLVLTSLALLLGTAILILSVYSNRRKKVVCVLKSYTPGPGLSVPGSPVPSERAPLTQHPMRLPQSSPNLQRGEILIEWKDGTVTPLYEA